jgi:hypothetical protein
MAREQREQNHRDHLGETYEAQFHYRVGSVVDFPPHGQGQHLLAKGGNEFSDEIEKEITIPKDCVGVVRLYQGCFWGVGCGVALGHKGESTYG